MYLKIHTGAQILAVIQLLLCVAWTSPNLGIRPDFRRVTGRQLEKDIQSYTGIIKLDDGTIPLDKSRMTDAKLLHLARVAYNEMVDIWTRRNLKLDALPGAMAAFAYRDKIYFGSSIRVPPGNAVQVKDVPQGSIRQFMVNAWDIGTKVHAHGGGCAEINVLELVWSENEEADPDKGPPAPRVAIWVRRQGRPVGSERNTPPCSWYGFAGAGYGCADIIRAYGVEAIDKNAAPDPAGEDDWTFSLAENPRPLCERPY